MRVGQAAAVLWLGCLGCGREEYALRRIGTGGADASTSAGSGGNAGMAGEGNIAGQAGSMAASLDCPPYSPGARLDTCSTSYLSGPEDDVLTSAAVAPDGSVLVAGSISRTFDGETALIPGYGALARLSPNGRELVSVTRLGGEVADLDVAGTGELAAAGDFGAVLLAEDAGSIVWQAPQAATRIAAGKAGNVAVLRADHSLGLYDAQGSLLLEFSLADDAVEDVAVDDVSGLVFVVGGNFRPGSSCQGMMPFLRAYDFAGNVRWRAYDFADALGNCASSRGYRVVLGDDQMLYYAGENQGGNTVHLKDPSDLAVPAPLVSYDSYTIGAGKAIHEYTFVARFEPASGKIVLGQVLVPRENDVGGYLYVRALAADAAGRVFLGGQATCCIADREQLTIGGQPLGPYQGGDDSVAILSADFSQRLTWTAWTGSTASALMTTSLAVGGGRVVMTASQSDSNAPVLTERALQSAPAGLRDGFFSVWLAP